MGRLHYTIDLARHMAECDANYLKIKKLFPGLETDSSYEFGLPMERDEVSKVVIDVMDRARYTTTIKITQSLRSIPWVSPQIMVVRIYHDARMAEVISFQTGRNFQPRYEYPNPQFYQKDEKAQLNRFLGEWLSHCLDQGLSMIKVVYP